MSGVGLEITQGTAEALYRTTPEYTSKAASLSFMLFGSIPDHIWDEAATSLLHKGVATGTFTNIKCFDLADIEPRAMPTMEMPISAFYLRKQSLFYLTSILF